MATASDLKTRYPEFEGVADSRIEVYLAEAAQRVGSDWDEADQPVATLALAAHNIALDGDGSNPASSGRGVIMRKVGDVTVEIAEPQESMTSLNLELTAYGRRYADIMRRNVATGVMAV